MTQSQDTQNNTSPNLDLLRKAGERALARLEKEFKVTLRDKDKLSEKKDPPPSRKGKTR